MLNNKKVNMKKINVNKVESRGYVTQIQMSVADVLDMMIEYREHDEDTLTGGVELCDVRKGLCSIGIHEELQYEFNIADLEGKYFVGHVDDEFSEITKEDYYTELKEKEYDTDWGVTDEGIMRYMYCDGYILLYVYNDFQKQYFEKGFTGCKKDL